MLTKIIFFVVGYCIGIGIYAWTSRNMIDIGKAKGIRFYYRPEDEFVEKLELFYTDDSFDDEKLKKCKIFFDRER